MKRGKRKTSKGRQREHEETEQQSEAEEAIRTSGARSPEMAKMEHAGNEDEGDENSTPSTEHVICERVQALGSNLFCGGGICLEANLSRRP